MAERPEISPDLAQSTVAGVIEQRVQLVSRRVMSQDNLQSLIEQFNLYADYPLSEQLQNFRAGTSLEQVDPISLEPSVGASAFSVHFDYSDPVIARDVAQSLIDLFVSDNRAVRTESAAGTEKFFAAEADRLAAAVTVAEDRLAVFKRDNQGALPQDIERNKQVLERINLNRTDNQGKLRLAVERRNLLMVQLEELSGGTELSKLRAELAIANQKYSVDHPDIKRLTRAIGALESSGEDANTMDVEYMRTSAQTEAVDVEIAAAKRRDAELRRRQSELEDKLVLAPEVEKQLQKLTRESELANEEYEDIRQRRSEARIGSNLEDQDKGQRYTVIRQPGVNTSPLRPNRLGIFLIAILFAVGGSAGLVSLRESADPSVRGSRDVLVAVQAPPIAVVPVIRNEADSRRHFRKLMAHGAAFLIVASLTLGIIVNG